jgi:hypothetical protein
LNYLLNLESNHAVAGVSVASTAVKKIVKKPTKIAVKSTKSVAKA